MASQPSTSFNEIIQKGREKKRNEALAQEIFGKSRNQTRNRPRTPQPAGSSLLSRVTKPGFRSASSSAINRHQLQNSILLPSSALDGRGARLERASGDQERNGKEFSIKGRAGPYVVIGSNFAPGTSELDIQATMEPVGGPMLGCSILTAHPTVISEMIFKEKSGADAVIARFNNQMADGRLLHFYLKKGPPQTPIANKPNSLNSIVQTGRDSARLELGALKDWSLSEPSLGESVGRSSLGRDRRIADPAIQDGTMGFPSSQEEHMEVDREPMPESRTSGQRSYNSAGRGDFRREDHYDNRRSNHDDRNHERHPRSHYNDRSFSNSKTLQSDRYARQGDHRGYR